MAQKPLLWVEAGAHAVRSRLKCGGVGCAAEAKERRAIFAANANANTDTPTNNP